MFYETMWVGVRDAIFSKIEQVMQSFSSKSRPKILLPSVSHLECKQVLLVVNCRISKKFRYTITAWMAVQTSCHYDMFSPILLGKVVVQKLSLVKFVKNLMVFHSDQSSRKYLFPENVQSLLLMIFSTDQWYANRKCMAVMTGLVDYE